MRSVIRIFLWGLLVMGLVANPSHCRSEGNEDDHAKRCARLLRASGVEGMLKTIPKSLLAVIPADIFPDTRTKTRMESLFLKTVAQSDSPGQCLVRSLSKNLDESAVSELLGFYESRVGRKVARLQEGMLDPGRLREIREGYKRVTLLEEPRLSLMKRLTMNQRLSSTNMEWTRAVVAGLMAGYVKDAPAANAVDSDVRKIIEHGTNIAREKSEEMRMISVANTFESLSNSELSEVAAFFDSDAAVKMRETLGICIKAALFHAAWTLGNCFREGTAPPSRPE